jgi:hypothetical protein
MEAYYRVQYIDEDEEKIQLASLFLEGTSLIWWEVKLQEGIQKSNNILSYWSEFKVALRKQFYPLAYRQFICYGMALSEERKMTECVRFY